MTNHTKGPWIAQTVREDTGFRMVRTHVLDGASGDIIATIHANGIAEEQANARLIAAAPELLEALVEAEAKLRILSEVAEDCRLDGAPMITEAAKKSRAAIAKATGYEKDNAK